MYLITIKNSNHIKILINISLIGIEDVIIMNNYINNFLIAVRSKYTCKFNVTINFCRHNRLSLV